MSTELGEGHTPPYAAIDRASIKNRMRYILLCFEHKEMSDNIVLQDSQDRPQQEILGRLTILFIGAALIY